MKLYEIPRKSLIRVTTDGGEETITFHHLDGMYSYCTTANGEAVHLAGNAPVSLCEDGIYEITPQPDKTLNHD